MGSVHDVFIPRNAQSRSQPPNTVPVGTTAFRVTDAFVLNFAVQWPAPGAGPVQLMPAVAVRTLPSPSPNVMTSRLAAATNLALTFLAAFISTVQVEAFTTVVQPVNLSNSVSAPP